ncbi:hypothetical protein [Bradyrhizobium sp. AZCC 1693]|uniref:hypothetical protein n=1 Tax=Bradyrhizobium sp. AZCC 1693 TaxID=3117029 RepID=UPI002FF15B57
MGRAATSRFLSPLIKPDVPISGIRLSDWFHRTAHGLNSDVENQHNELLIDFFARHLT